MKAGQMDFPYLQRSSVLLQRPLSKAGTRNIVFALLLAVLLSLTSCSASEDAGSASSASGLQRITINYPTRSGASWPMFLAKEGGYYEKHGLDVELVFGVHPTGIAMLVSGEAQMSNYSLEQAMLAGSTDGSLTIVGSTLNKGLFTLMARPDVSGPEALLGKRMAIGQIGDAPYNYSVALLGKLGLGPRDVQWVPVGTDVSGRVAALETNRADATLLTAPAFFRMEEAGYKSLGRLSDYDDIFASTVYVFRKSTVEADPTLPERIIKAQAEAIRRFYEDKDFAVDAYMAYDTQERADVERIYEHYAAAGLFERVPYVLSGAIQSVIDQQADEQIAARLRGFDFGVVVDNGIVERLVREGFFEELYGAEIRSEQDRKAGLAFR